MDDSTGEHRPDSVGYRIAKAVERHGELKPKDLEAPAGLDRGSIFKLLRGDRDSTSLEAGLRIAAFLGENPYDFLPEVDRRAIAAFGGVLMAEPFCVKFPDGSTLYLDAKVTVPKDSTTGAGGIVDQLEAAIRSTFKGPGISILASRKLAMPPGTAPGSDDTSQGQSPSDHRYATNADIVDLQGQIDRFLEELREMQRTFAPADPKHEQKEPRTG